MNASAIAFAFLLAASPSTPKYDSDKGGEYNDGFRKGFQEGDPAPGQRKSLEVTYICGKVVRTASAYEHRSLYLDCTN